METTEPCRVCGDLRGCRPDGICPPLVLCDYCDEYHEAYVGCPYYEDFRRTTDVDDEEIERDAFARHDRRLFG
jgi:hypothetical protein